MPCDDRSGDWNDTAACQGKSRIDSDHQKLGRVKEGFYSESQKEPTLPTPWFWTSSIQNYWPKQHSLPLHGRILQKTDGSKTTKSLDLGILDIWGWGYGLYPDWMKTPVCHSMDMYRDLMLANYRNLLLWGFSLFQTKINSPTGARGRALNGSVRSSTRYLCSPGVLVWNKDVSPKAKYFWTVCSERANKKCHNWYRPEVGGQKLHREVVL